MKFAKFKTQLLLTTFLFLVQVLTAHAGLINRINESEFSNPDTLNFLSSSSGSISSTDSLFTNFGISELTAVASAADGEEYARGDYQQALWANESSGVEIVVNNGDGCSLYDANFKCIGVRKLSLVDYYSISFIDDLTKVGFYMVDVWKPLVFSFYNNGELVEVYDEQERGAWDGNALGTGTGWTAWRAFESTVAFDQVRIDSKDSDADGFGIAMITKDGVVVTEPSTLIVMTLGLAGLLSSRRRKVNI